MRARTIGFIFQTFNLLPVLTAEENVEYPLLQFREVSARQRRERVAQLLDLVKLTRACEASAQSALRRAAPARRDCTRTGDHPRVVLADEPTANLDHRTGGRILRLMRKINRHYGTTFIFSTHDPRVLDVADRRVDIEDGAIIRLGVRVGETWSFAPERSGDVRTPEESGLD